MTLKKNKKKTYQTGLWGEYLAEAILRLKGYSIKERRYKTPVGEVDIIASKKHTLVFIEVKTRANITNALESITPKMQNRITRAAQHYISRNTDEAEFDMRFDLIAIKPPFFWRHIYNAWLMTA